MDDEVKRIIEESVAKVIKANRPVKKVKPDKIIFDGKPAGYDIPKDRRVKSETLYGTFNPEHSEAFKKARKELDEAWEDLYQAQHPEDIWKNIRKQQTHSESEPGMGFSNFGPQYSDDLTKLPPELKKLYKEDPLTFWRIYWGDNQNK